MPTNEQRRATAKRKLERQLERRAAQARRRRLLTIVGGMLGALLVIGAVVATVVFVNKDTGTSNASPTTGPTNGAAPGATVGCQYPAAGAASKPVKPPKTQDGKVPTDPPRISVSMATNQGNIGLQLDQAKAPCTVNSFVSLATQGFFDDTPCHRLTTGASLSVLQCGDPTGQGTGGPGYQFANEFPTNSYKPGDPALQQPIAYPRGTLAMANSGPDTNGSQFFLVYKDSQLPPGYTMFGTIDQTGLATLDKIAAAGVVPGEGGAGDGKPKLDVRVKSILPD